jgi:hypothetical protein
VFVQVIGLFAFRHVQDQRLQHTILELTLGRSRSVTVTGAEMIVFERALYGLRSRPRLAFNPEGALIASLH